jgi:hypothetical protein
MIREGQRKGYWEYDPASVKAIEEDLKKKLAEKEANKFKLVETVEREKPSNSRW